MLTVPAVPITVYQLPGDSADALPALIRTIDSATATLDAELFQLTHPAIITAIAQAHGRGVAIRLLLEHTEAGTPVGVLALHSLLSQGVQPTSVRITTSEVEHAFAHKKVLVIDRLITVDGSTNMTRSAFNERNHLQFITHAAYAAACTAAIDTHWAWTATAEAAYQTAV